MTLAGSQKILVDSQLRLTSNTTIQGAAQAKGTATDCLLTVIAGLDGVNPVAGTVTVTIQGANATTFAAPTTIVPDKGSIVNLTVAGAQTVHLAQLQFAFYRVALSAATATTCDTSAIWNFQPMEDSFDSTQQ